MRKRQSNKNLIKKQQQDNVLQNEQRLFEFKAQEEQHLKEQIAIGKQKVNLAQLFLENEHKRIEEEKLFLLEKEHEKKAKAQLELRLAEEKSRLEQIEIDRQSKADEALRKHREKFEKAKNKILTRKMSAEPLSLKSEALTSEADLKPTRNLVEAKHTYLNGDMFYVFGKQYPLKIKFNDLSSSEDIVVFENNTIVLQIKRATGTLACKKLINRWYKSVLVKRLRLVVNTVHKNVGCKKNVRVRIMDTQGKWFVNNYGDSIIWVHSDFAKLPTSFLDYALTSEMCILKMRESGKTEAEITKEYYNMLDDHMENWRVIKNALSETIYLE